MTKNPQDKDHNLIPSQDQKLLEKWLSDVQQNPHFAKEGFYKKEGFLDQAKSLLGELTKTIGKEEIPDFSVASYQPLIKLWHQIHKQHQATGFSTKDTAMFVFSLKSTLLSLFENQETDKESLDKLRSLLDFLGFITFEIYSSEQESLISKQDHQIEYLQSSSKPFRNLIGNSEAMKAVYKAIEVVLDNDVTVLLQGESGTGKDVVANVIHENSSRKQKPFITLNCGAIPKELIESELFGHEKGAFTGADTRKLGKFELANGGTLFLDEIGELSMDMQVKFLRVLQNREIERIGGQEKIKIDVRIIAATNKDLEAEIENKKFRLDLFYRLNVFPIMIPNLSQRKADIVPLGMHFIQNYSKSFGLKEIPALTQDAQQYLKNKDWPGNIRELENVIQRALLLSDGRPLTQALCSIEPGKLLELPEYLEEEEPFPSVEDVIPLEMVEHKAILNALKHTGGNVQQTANLLKVARGTLYNKFKKYDLDPAKYTE